MSNFTLQKSLRRQIQSTASSTPYFILICTLTLSLVLQSAESAPEVPCYFVFGDSLSDNGNSNDLKTSAKANYPPYGIDYPDHQATGRFSNGKNIVDVISERLQLVESVPPFASTATMEAKDLLKGVNYASGSAGILPETGKHLGDRIPLGKQVDNHESVISRISGVISKDPSYLSKCLYTITIGSNDYLNNYYVPENYTTSQEYTPEKFAQVLIKEYSVQIRRLYGMGARKVALFGLLSLGLIPQAISKFGRLDAKKLTLSSTLLFNDGLHKLVDKLNSRQPGTIVTCINIDLIFFNGLMYPDSCCEVRSDGQCKEDSDPCTDRRDYAFFDNFNPTEAMNYQLGDRSYKATFFLDVHPYPVDIETLVLTPTT